MESRGTGVNLRRGPESGQVKAVEYMEEVSKYIQIKGSGIFKGIITI